MGTPSSWLEYIDGPTRNFEGEVDWILLCHGRKAQDGYQGQDHPENYSQSLLSHFIFLSYWHGIAPRLRSIKPDNGYRVSTVTTRQLPGN